jgi:hypothetical protein
MSSATRGGFKVHHCPRCRRNVAQSHALARLLRGPKTVRVEPAFPYDESLDLNPTNPPTKRQETPSEHPNGRRTVWRSDRVDFD